MLELLKYEDWPAHMCGPFSLINMVVGSGDAFSRHGWPATSCRWPFGRASASKFAPGEFVAALDVHGWTNAAKHMDVREWRTSSKNIPAAH